MLLNLSCVLCVLGWGLFPLLVSDIYKILYYFPIFLCLFYCFFPPSVLPMANMFASRCVGKYCSAGKCLMQKCSRSSGRWLGTPQESILWCRCSVTIDGLLQRWIVLSCIIAGRWRFWFQWISVAMWEWLSVTLSVIRKQGFPQ